jgi:CheY-like chemotaxis protein
MDQSQKVLVVDDEYLIRWALVQSLSEAGYEVTAVESGDQAFEAAQNEHFDFVVTDLSMPGLNGWQLLDKLIGLKSSPRVIVMTSQSEEDHYRRVRDRGGWAYVEKDSTLLGEVRQALKKVSGE